MATKFWFALLLGSSLIASENWLDLEDKAQDFVLKATKVEIPGYCHAFNPSIVRWQNSILLCFRMIPDAANPYISHLGVILLDEHFSPITDPQILATRESSFSVPSRAEDARLLYVGDALYIVYSDNDEINISKGGFRVFIGELAFDGAQFLIKRTEKLKQYEGETRQLREKNWVPFDYNGNLLLAYSLLPHTIFMPIRNGACLTLCTTTPDIDWPYGLLRGGTPGLLVGEEYLSFFHSSIPMATLHSDGKTMLHYFMGAYTYEAYPPFTITKISPEPIIGKQFYKGPIYQRYWGSVRVVFPGGYIFDDDSIWLAYGRQDHEVWIAQLDRKKLLASLVPVRSALPE